MGVLPPPQKALVSVLNSHSIHAAWVLGRVTFVNCQVFYRHGAPRMAHSGQESFLFVRIAVPDLPWVSNPTPRCRN